MLNETDSLMILHGLVNQGSQNGSETHANQYMNCYNAELALFTQLPNDMGKNYTEVALSGYARKDLTGYGIAGGVLFNDSAAWDSTAGVYKVTNSAPIQMHSIDETETNSAQVLGFGIFASTSANATNKRLVAWGPLVDANDNPVTSGVSGTAPTLTGGAVPVFYPGDFVLTFGGSSATSGMSDAICIGMLNTLVQQGATTPIGGTNTYELKTYQAELALFTALPNAQGVGAVEVPTTIEVSGDTVVTGYSRKALYGPTPTSGQLQFEDKGRFHAGKYVIANTDEIQMSCMNQNLSQSYQVMGFGIYAAESNEGTKRLIAWGPLVDSNGNPVTADSGGTPGTAPKLTGGSVPLFYTSNFQLMLGGEDSGQSWISVTGVSLKVAEFTALSQSTEFVADTYYKKNNDGTFQLLDTAPSDWTTNYEYYYTRALVDPAGENTKILSYNTPIQFQALVTPANATNPDVEWIASNTNVTVDQNGLVRAGAARGSCNITARTRDEGKVASYTVTSAAAKPTGITFTPTSPSIKRWTGGGTPTGSPYVATISAAATPVGVAEVDSKCDFSISGNLIKLSETDTSIQVYSNAAQAGTGTVTARLRGFPSVTSTVYVTITLN